MKTLIAIALLTSFLAGCGTVSKSSGALKVGPDTYRVFARAPFGEIVGSQQMAFTEANAYCDSLQKHMVANSTSIPGHLQGFELTVRCLSTGDFDLVRPNLQRAPDAVIQLR
jgi:hypothetical protein